MILHPSETPAGRVLRRLYTEAVAKGFRNHARARLRQITAHDCGASIGQLAAIWRDEFSYLPEDRAEEEERANGSE